MNHKEPLRDQILCCLVFAALGVLMAGVLIEWAAGCGEHYIDAAGVTHQNECIFLDRGDRHGN